jgi:hypothetical protein
MTGMSASTPPQEENMTGRDMKSAEATQLEIAATGGNKSGW